MSRAIEAKISFIPPGGHWDTKKWKNEDVEDCLKPGSPQPTKLFYKKFFNVQPDNEQGLQHLCDLAWQKIKECDALDNPSDRQLGSLPSIVKHGDKLPNRRRVEDLLLSQHPDKFFYCRGSHLPDWFVKNLDSRNHPPPLKMTCVIQRFLPFARQHALGHWGVIAKKRKRQTFERNLDLDWEYRPSLRRSRAEKESSSPQVSQGQTEERSAPPRTQSSSGTLEDDAIVSGIFDQAHSVPGSAPRSAQSSRVQVKSEPRSPKVIIDLVNDSPDRSFSSTHGRSLAASTIKIEHLLEGVKSLTTVKLIAVKETRDMLFFEQRNYTNIGTLLASKWNIDSVWRDLLPDLKENHDMFWFDTEEEADPMGIVTDEHLRIAILKLSHATADRAAQTSVNLFLAADEDHMHMINSAFRSMSTPHHPMHMTDYSQSS